MNSLVVRALEDFVSSNPNVPEATMWLEQRCVMMSVSGSGGAHGTLSVLVESKAHEGRGLLLKIARESASDHLKQEVGILRSVHESVSPELSLQIPQPLHTGRIANHMYSLVTLLPGNCWDSVSFVYRRCFGEKVALRAVEWIGRLGRETIGEGKGSPADNMCGSEDDIAWTTQNTTVQAKVKGAREILRECRSAIPRVVQHGDFWPGNIMLGSSGTITGVVDWEGCMLQGYPGCDCMTLLRTAGVSKVGATRLLEKYCEVIQHPAVTPAICRALGILDVLRTRRIVDAQCSGMIVRNANRSVESILGAI